MTMNHALLLRRWWDGRRSVVAQSCTLLYRRFATCMAARQPEWPSNHRTVCRMQFGDTAEFNSALRAGRNSGGHGGDSSVRTACLSARPVIFALLLSGVLPASAASFAEWQQQQDIEVGGTGLVRVNLPAETLDAARPGLEDLRLVDPAGNDVPWLIERPMPAPPTVHAVRSFRSSLEDQTTVLLIETGLERPVTAVLLQSPAREFLKAARVQGSVDGQRWSVIAEGVPIFRQAGGASGLQVEFTAGQWPWLRVSVDDARSDPVPFTGASLRAAALEVPPSLPLEVVIAERNEGVDETRLTLALPAANLTLASLEVETDEPLFTRNVTLAAPEVSGDGLREETMASGTILRFGGNGRPVVMQRTLTVERQIAARELVLRIHNGDSPPLAVTGVRALRRPVHLVFFAREAGAYSLFVGNPLCELPRYDIAALSNQLRAGGGQLPEATVGTLRDHPEYRAPEALPGLATIGAPLDVSNWRHRKPIRIERAGVQTLELDLEVLARAQRPFGDLRIMRDDHQLPFLVEHTSITRAIEPEVAVVTDPKRPTVSRWLLTLPQANLPVNRLVCDPVTPMFERHVRVFEQTVDSHGMRRTRELGSAAWSRAPGRPVRTLEIALSQAPQTDTLFLETDNGDNLPIQLSEFKLLHPVTRLVFKAEPGAAPALYYGNPNVTAPSYDLRLVGRQLLAAPKVSAALGAQEDLKTGSWTEGAPLTGVRGLLFWGMLALVVIALLVIIARLLPKSASADSKE